MGKDTKTSFVFLSENRWKRVKILFLLLFMLSFLAFSFTAYRFPKNSFPQNFQSNKTQIIIDGISQKTPGSIEIEGNGPVISILEKEGNYSFERSNISNGKLVFLTFDDGPDPIYSQKIVDVLGKENVKATFFVIGENISKYPKVLRQIDANGHLVAAHTFSHTPEDQRLYGKDFKMYQEFELTQKLIEKETGKTTKIFRLPYWGTEETITLNNLVLASNAAQRGYKIVGSTVDSFDYQYNVEEIVKNAQNLQVENPVILMHDGGGNRQNTIEALPQIIQFYKSQNYQFATVEQLYPNETLVFKTPFWEVVTANFTVLNYQTFKRIPIYVSSLFIFGLIAFSFHTVIILILAFLDFYKNRRVLARSDKTYEPLVSIVIPVYNEESVIAKTIKSILKSKYENIEILVVNDGSSDETDSKIYKFLKNPKVTIIWQPNRGKHSALNTGFMSAYGSIVISIDADTQIMPSAIGNLVKHFQNPKVAAVAGTIKVGNQINFLTKMQEMEYRMGINLERRAYNFLDSVYIVPGAIGAWRRQAVLKVGGYWPDTLTEDAELSFRLKKAGYRINFESEAVGYTEAPRTISALLTQRFRWSLGLMQTFWLHKSMCFKSEYGAFGLLVLPYTIFVQIPSMALSLFIELLAIPIAIFFSPALVASVISLMLFTKLVLFAFATRLAKEDFSLAPYIFPYRFLYQFFLYYVLNVAIITAIKGSFVAWTKSEHLGQVELVKIAKVS